MKFLLCAVNAKYIHSNPAVYSLRAYAGEGLRPHIEIAEYTINNEKDAILADIYNRHPDVIAFSCYIWNWRLIQELLEELPKLMPGVPIWLGGPEVTYDAPQILERYPVLTGIMVGEGEETFKELAGWYMEQLAEQRKAQEAGKQEWQSHDRQRTEARSQSRQRTEARSQGGQQTEAQNQSGQRARLHQIAGLCLKDGFTPARPLTDMDSLPFLYENLADFQNRIIYYESSRGCPYQCSYCLSSIDKKVRFRDISVVKKELQFFLDHKVKQVKFVDRTFNCSHEHAMEIWRYLLEHDNGVTNFHFEISADILREDELALLQRMRPGLVQLEIGVQSVNPRTIQAINRVMNVERLEQIVEAIHKGHNIHQHLDLIAGLPYEDYESFGRSFDRVYRMKPEQLQLGFLKVLKGSEMYERAEEFGICYQSRPPYEVLYTRWLPYSDVLRLKKVEEMVELYYNSNQYTHTLPFLEKAFSSPFAMFEALAGFFEEKGYFTNSPARAYRYQVLLSFAESYDPEYQEVYRELLTFDLYLRENAKSRPEFAGDPAPFKEQARSFYQAEEKNRRYLPDYQGYDSRQMAKMTHLEPFWYPVWDEEGMERLRDGGREAVSKMPKTACYVLFDYQKRDSLTYEAGIQVICRL